ncbi:MAG: PhzF family phenazine biosynthesis protein [Thermoplasmata archaeon]|nr:PhzF family phenazine biosynthesis protein [Thermoplasmata archaeon]
MNGISKYKEIWLECYRVNAFTDKPFSGNPAGVVLDTIGLSSREMQNIAKELACSETAFITKSNRKNYFKVRFFSPSVEVDLCGHATIASFFTLAKKDYIEKESRVTTVVQETNAGILPVKIYYRGGKIERVMMKQRQPMFRQVKIDIATLSEALGVNETELNEAFPLEAVSTGLFSLPVYIERLETLLNLKPNFELVKKLCKRINVGSIHAFSLETMEKNSTLHARNFAPVYGVNEDPVTGTANGALCSHLVKNDLVKKNSFICEQGDAIARPGRVFVEISKKNDIIEDVYVGGKAIIVQEGMLRIR